MKKKTIAVFFICGLILSRCSEKSTLETDATLEPTFSSINSQVFQRNCALSGCHGGGSANAGLSLEEGVAYQNLVNVNATQNPSLKRVQPGNSGLSYIMFKLNGEGTTFMPPSGKLPADTRNIIKQWIDNGAADD